MKLSVLALLLAPLVLARSANAQQFEKNSAANLFGDDGKVQMYGGNPANEPNQPAGVDSTDPRKAQEEFLRRMCENVGPKSSACRKLEELKNGSGAAATKALGFDPGYNDTTTQPTDGFGKESAD